MKSRIRALLPLVLLLTACGVPKALPLQDPSSNGKSTEGTSTGNPLVPMNFEGCRGYMTLEVCIDQISFYNGTTARQLPMGGRWVTIDANGATLSDLPIPTGTFNSINISLANVCGENVSARLTNKNGTFTLSNSAHMYFTGSASVSSTTTAPLQLNMANFMQLSEVTNDSDFYIAIMSSAGTF